VYDGNHLSRETEADVDMCQIIRAPTDQRHILNDPTQVAPYHTETARTVEQINNKV